MSDESGKKFDQGKPRMELIPWAAVNYASTFANGGYSQTWEIQREIGAYLEGGPIEHLGRAVALCFDYADSDNWWGSYLEVAAVLTYGANKYAPHNWRKGGTLTQGRTIGAALRHIAAEALDEGSLDEETGRTHMAHARCELLFALTYALEGRGDDRWKASEPQKTPVQKTLETADASGRPLQLIYSTREDGLILRQPDGADWYWYPGYSYEEWIDGLEPEALAVLGSRLLFDICAAFYEERTA